MNGLDVSILGFIVFVAGFLIGFIVAAMILTK